MKLLSFALAIVASLNVAAVEEHSLAEAWPSKIHPFYESLEKGSFRNSQNLRISYRYLYKKENQYSLVVLPGQAEPAIKYAELLYDLKALDHNIFIMDHQGQGESERLLPDSQKGHVRYFQDYVTDLKQFVNEVVTPRSETRPLRLLAHSMGGAISLLYLSQNPGVFERAIVNAPMLHINTKPYPESIAYGLSKFLVKVKQGHRYAPGRGPYRPEKDDFETNPFTNSPDRHAATKHINVTWPEQVIGGPTSNWVFQSLKATKQILEIAPMLDLPLLLIQAGNDLIVRTPKQTAFCDLAPTCERKLLPHAKHEILMEKDEDRDKAIGWIKEFLDR